MAVFKTIDQIMQNKWNPHSQDIKDYKKFPKKNLKYSIKEVYSYQDIEVWEELYHKPGNIGIYAAWSPFVECYILVHYLFLDTNFGIETYNDENAMDNLVSRAKELGITLSSDNIWVDSIDFQNFTEI